MKPTLTKRWDQIQARLSQDFVMFPAGLDDADVDWPDDNWSAFLDAAQHCGCRLIYAAHHVVTEADIDDIVGALDDPEEAASAYVAAAIEAVRRHMGATGRVELAFAHSGVRHRWLLEEPWLADLDDAAGERDALRRGVRVPAATSEEDERLHYPWRSDEFEKEQETERLRLLPLIDEWVVTVSEHPDYIAARNKDLRRMLAGQLVPELQTWTLERDGTSPTSLARRRAAYNAIDLAEQRLDKVKAGREARGLQDAEGWVAELRQDPSFRPGRTAEERKQWATEYVTGQLGFMSTRVRTRLLSAIGKVPIG